MNIAELMARLGLYPNASKAPCVVGYEAAGNVGAEELHRLWRDDRLYGYPGSRQLETPIQFAQQFGCVRIGGCTQPRPEVVFVLIVIDLDMAALAIRFNQFQGTGVVPGARIAFTSRPQSASKKRRLRNSESNSFGGFPLIRTKPDSDG
jgi:hypothetical protein